MWGECKDVKPTTTRLREKEVICPSENAGKALYRGWAKKPKIELN